MSHIFKISGKLRKKFNERQCFNTRLKGVLFHTKQTHGVSDRVSEMSIIDSLGLRAKYEVCMRSGSERST